jgi:hypothetical protein
VTACHSETASRIAIESGVESVRASLDRGRVGRTGLLIHKASLKLLSEKRMDCVHACMYVWGGGLAFTGTAVRYVIRNLTV